MPKIRTNKTAAKRFKVTGSGKIMRANTGKGHLMMKKSASRKRRLSLESTVFAGETQKLYRMVPSLNQ
jgi:large subunit ribosomal protein L35